jgi:hypothetical protein
MICGSSLPSSHPRPQHRHHKADPDRGIEGSSRYKKATSFRQIPFFHLIINNRKASFTGPKPIFSKSLQQNPSNRLRSNPKPPKHQNAILPSHHRHRRHAPRSSPNHPRRSRSRRRAPRGALASPRRSPGVPDWRSHPRWRQRCLLCRSEFLNRPLNPSESLQLVQGKSFAISSGYDKLTSSSMISVSAKANPTVATAMTMMFASAIRLK